MDGFENVKLLAEENGITVNLVKKKNSNDVYVKKSVVDLKTSSGDLPPAIVVDKQSFTDYEKIASPYLVKCSNFFVDSKKSSSYILEYCSKGDLFSLFSEKFRNKTLLPGQTLKAIIAQLSVALFTLHSKNIKHGNIKIDNIYTLNDEGDKLKIGGFGTINSTYNGLPPEIRSKQPYTLKTDIYSLGFVILQLYTSQAVVRSFGVGSQSNLSDGLKALVAKMLSENPNNRPTIAEIVQNADVKDAILTLLPKDSLPAELLAAYHITVPATKPASAPAPTPAPSWAKPVPSTASTASTPTSTTKTTTPVASPKIKPSAPAPAPAPVVPAAAAASPPASSTGGPDQSPNDKFKALTDADYLAIFKMTRAAFHAMSDFKQITLRRQNKLFGGK